MKLRQLTLALSLVGASSIGLVGCGGSSNNYDEEEFPITVVAAYLDDCTVTDGTNTATQTAIGVYAFNVEPSGSITASNCVNTVTGSTVPPLSTPSGQTVVSPVTTMVANGATEAQVRTAFGITDSSVNVFADPIVLASNGDQSLLRASVKISSLVELAVAAGGAGSDALSGIATAVQSATDTDTLNSGVTSNLGLNASSITAVDSIIEDQTNIATLEGAIDAVKDNATAINALTTDGAADTLVDSIDVEPAEGDAVTPIDGGDVDDGSASGGSGGSGGSGVEA